MTHPSVNDKNLDLIVGVKDITYRITPSVALMSMTGAKNCKIINQGERISVSPFFIHTANTC